MAWEKIETAPVHNFEEEKVIEGKLKEIVDGKYGDNYVIETEDGEKTVFGSTVINGKISEKLIGELIRIEYIGEKKADSTGRMYKDFLVQIDK